MQQGHIRAGVAQCWVFVWQACRSARSTEQHTAICLCMERLCGVFRWPNVIALSLKHLSGTTETLYLLGWRFGKLEWYPRKLHLMQHGLNAEISICNYHIQFCPAWLFWAHRLELDSDLASLVWPVKWLSANSSYISKVKLTYRLANQPATLPECKSCRGNQILSTEWVFVLPCAYTHTHTMLIFCLLRFTQSPHKCAHHSFSNPFEVSSIDLTRSEASIVKTSQEWHALQELTAKHKNWKIYSKAHPQSKTRYFQCSIQSGLRQSFAPKPQIQSGLRSWKNKGNLFSNFNRRTFKLVRSVV